MKEIFAGIEAADNFVFVLSPESAASETCQKEAAHAFANNKRIIPILHREVPASAVPEGIGRLNWIYFRDSDDFDATFASLLKVLDTDLDWKRSHSRLLVRAKEWERESREKNFLLRGKDLREAEEWQAQTADKEPKATSLHSEYILASRRAEIRRQRQQLASVVVALILTVGLAIAALMQWNTARKQLAIATSRQLAVQSTSLVEKKPDLALLLALEAGKSDDSFEARSALFTALGHQPRIQTFLRGVGNPSSGFHSRRLNALAVARDGETIAAVSGLDGRAITLWDGLDPAPYREPRGSHRGGRKRGFQRRRQDAAFGRAGQGPDFLGCSKPPAGSQDGSPGRHYQHRRLPRRRRGGVRRRPKWCHSVEFARPLENRDNIESQHASCHAPHVSPGRPYDSGMARD